MLQITYNDGKKAAAYVREFVRKRAEARLMDVSRIHQPELIAEDVVYDSSGTR